MLESCKIEQLTRTADILINGYRTCLALLTCNPPNILCFFNECKNCPGYENLRQIFENAFEHNNVESIVFNQWMCTDRAKLETFIQSAEDFVDSFIERLPKLLLHDFIAKEQSKYIRQVKNNLEIGEVVVNMDFAENYSFVIQDEVQAYHWTNQQATIHPFAIYYRTLDKREPHFLNCVIISDALEHNTVAVHIFQRYLINFLRQKLGNISKIFYFSDGSAAQYKNRKNFYNLTIHEQEFDIKAEWNFFATAHGKSACDGLGGTVKRLAARASLQRPYSQQIRTPIELFNWANANIKNMNFRYISSTEYNEEEQKFQNIYNNIIAVPHTQKIHHVSPISPGKITAKFFSLDIREFIYNLNKNTA